MAYETKSSYVYCLLRCMYYLNKPVFSNKSYPIQGAFCTNANIFHSPHDTQTTIANVIVSRGDWLGKPANFKGLNNSVLFEVELTRHVTLTVHTTNKMADATNELFVFWRRFWSDFEYVRGGWSNGGTLFNCSDGCKYIICEFFGWFRP